MRHTTTLCSLLAASVLPLSAMAQNWTLIDNFEDGVDNWAIFAQMDATASILATPYAEAGDGTFMYVNTGGMGGQNWGDTHVGTPLPMQFNVGDSGTLYFKAWMAGPSNNWHVHLSDQEAPTSWGANVFTLRYTWENDIPGILQGHDGSAYVTYAVTDDGFFPELMGWHEFWMAFSVVEGGSSWELYWKGPSDATVQGPMPFLKEGNATAGGFRRTPEGGLKTLTVSSNAGNPSGGGFGQKTGDLWLLDDFYITTGLYGGVDPIDGGTGGDTYGGYTIEEGWINTDNIGWVYVGDGTSLNGWVYSDATAGMNLGWLYMHPDNMSGSGDWVYIPR